MQLVGAVLGVPFALAQLGYKPGPADEVDRAMRIIHNKTQNHVDLFAYRGAIVGAGVGGVYGIFTQGKVIAPSLRMRFVRDAAAATYN